PVKVSWVDYVVSDPFNEAPLRIRTENDEPLCVHLISPRAIEKADLLPWTGLKSRSRHIYEIVNIPPEFKGLPSISFFDRESGEPVVEFKCGYDYMGDASNIGDEEPLLTDYICLLQDIIKLANECDALMSDEWVAAWYAYWQRAWGIEPEVKP